MTRRDVLVVLALLVVGLGAVACGGPSLRVERGQDLRAALAAWSERGDGGRLADVTDFAWDAVHVFSEGASAEAVQAAVGEPVLADEFYFDAGNLLVFSDDGEVARAVSVVPELLVTGGQPEWTSAVRLEPRGDRPPVSPRLVEG